MTPYLDPHPSRPVFDKPVAEKVTRRSGHTSGTKGDADTAPRILSLQRFRAGAKRNTASLTMPNFADLVKLTALFPGTMTDHPAVRPLAIASLGVRWASGDAGVPVSIMMLCPGRREKRHAWQPLLVTAVFHIGKHLPLAPSQLHIPPRL